MHVRHYSIKRTLSIHREIRRAMWRLGGETSGGIKNAFADRFNDLPVKRLREMTLQSPTY
jgi:hypothetical protein